MNPDDTKKISAWPSQDEGRAHPVSTLVMCSAVWVSSEWPAWGDCCWDSYFSLICGGGAVIGETASLGKFQPHYSQPLETPASSVSQGCYWATQADPTPSSPGVVLRPAKGWTRRKKALQAVEYISHRRGDNYPGRLDPRTVLEWAMWLSEARLYLPSYKINDYGVPILSKAASNGVQWPLWLWR